MHVKNALGKTNVREINNGEVRPMEINDDILHKAIDNTVELIKSMIEVVE